jgi:serine/threonine protein kinase
VQQGDAEPLSELEIKHGLQKIAQTLSFVHDSCKRVHCNLSPQSIILAADGTWKLAGFGLSQPSSSGANTSTASNHLNFVGHFGLRHNYPCISPACCCCIRKHHSLLIQLDQYVHACAEELPGLASSGQVQKRFHFDYESKDILDRLAKPDLAFSAPELVSSVSEAPITGAADTFSLACIAYRMLRGQNMFTAQTTSEYRGTLASMNLLPVDGLPDSLQVRTSVLATVFRYCELNSMAQMFIVRGVERLACIVQPWCLRKDCNKIACWKQSSLLQPNFSSLCVASAPSL